MNNYTFVNYCQGMNIPDGIYCARYNAEPAIIRMREGVPTYVDLPGFLNAEGEARPSCIFHPKGILHSSVELLLPAQELPTS